MNPNRTVFLGLLISMIVCNQSQAQTRQTSVWEAELPLTFHYSEPQDWSGAFSCAGLILADLGLEQCFAMSSFGMRLYTGLEADIFPKLMGEQIRIVPDVQVEYTLANPEYQYFVAANGERYATPGQTLLRMAIGFSTRFTERGRWGEGYCGGSPRHPPGGSL
jgi:hypothetical protein